MQYPSLYLDWVKYLIKKRKYGAWMKDVSIYVIAWNLDYMDIRDRKQLFFVPNQRHIKAFLCNLCNEVSMDILIKYLEHRYLGYRTSGVDWSCAYKDFLKIRHPKEIVLSKKLSKKITRANNKESWSKHYKGVEEQPWYNKNYEKNYSKKIWKK